MPRVTYTTEEVEALLRAEREATVRAMGRFIRDEVVGVLDERLGLTTKLLLTSREVRTVIGCGEKRLGQHVADRRLVPVAERGPGGGYLFRRDDVLALAEALSAG